MVENKLRWFEHVERRPIDSVVRRVDQMEDRQLTRPRKTIRETIRKELEINEWKRLLLLLLYLRILYVKKISFQCLIEDHYDCPHRQTLLKKLWGKNISIKN